MQGGALKWRLTIKRAVMTRSAMGTKTPDWTDLETGVPAKLEQVSDVQRDAGDQREASITARFKLRWSPLRATVNQLDELLCDGVLYEIVAVKEPDLRRVLEWSCKARQGQVQGA